MQEAASYELLKHSINCLEMKRNNKTLIVDKGVIMAFFYGFYILIHLMM